MSAVSRAHLQLVPSTVEELRPSRWFCGHCGALTDVTPAPPARVCGDCNLGMLLESRADMVPQAGEPFLIVDSSLTIQAISAEAERLLAIAEHDLVSRPVTELLVSADAEARGAREFADTITWAARGDDAPHRLTVRPLNVFGVRMPMRVGVCGPPRAALLVLE